MYVLITHGFQPRSKKNTKQNLMPGACRNLRGLHQGRVPWTALGMGCSDGMGCRVGVEPSLKLPYCWWFRVRDPAWTPVEVGSWNPINLQGFLYIQTVVGCLGFLNQQQEKHPKVNGWIRWNCFLWLLVLKFRNFKSTDATAVIWVFEIQLAGKLSFRSRTCCSKRVRRVFFSLRFSAFIQVDPGRRSI